MIYKIQFAIPNLRFFLHCLKKKQNKFAIFKEVFVYTFIINTFESKSDLLCLGFMCTLCFLFYTAVINERIQFCSINFFLY